MKKKNQVKEEIGKLEISRDNWKAIALDALQELWEIRNKKYLKKINK